MNKSKQTKSMKRLLTMAGLVIITAASSQVYAQNGVGINPTGAAAHPSAVLDASSTTQGFLPPRMTATQRDAIANPATGLVVFCTNCGQPSVGGELQVYSGGFWRNIAGGNAAGVIAIGQSFGGGIVAYILQPSDPGYDANVLHGLIAAPSDQGTAQWGCYGTTIAGADGSAIGTGNQNTIDIMSGCATANIAASVCGDLFLNNYSDWYLPSIAELEKLYFNIGQGAPAPNTNIGGFTDDIYWSSTEFNETQFNATQAYYFYFNFGIANGIDKFTTTYVRAVRAF
jgi:hypothetical protein